LDDFRDEKSLKIKAQSGFIGLTCTKGCQFVKYVLDEIGIKSRLVLTLTNDHLNGYNDGHTLLEVFDDNLKRYIVVDVDKKISFLDENSTLMNAFELCKAIAGKREFKTRSIGVIDQVDWIGFKDPTTDYNYQLLEQLFNSSGNTRTYVYDRICNSIVLPLNNLNYCSSFGEELKNDWKNKVQLLAPEEFEKKFY
jgi:hypothetical protein